MTDESGYKSSRLVSLIAQRIYVARAQKMVLL